MITKAANDYGLDPTTLAVLIFWESGGDPNALSSDGAVGLMQVMPRDGVAATFQCLMGLVLPVDLQ
ncbi:MAG: transglycosylase SLT domain-containing protein [Patescibacteria group bacterium]